jgi:hypothetical protein
MSARYENIEGKILGGNEALLKQNDIKYKFDLNKTFTISICIIKK